MPETKRLKKFMDENKVKYEIIPHSKAYTAQRVASSTHLSGQIIVKTVVVKIDGKFALAVLPANDRVSFKLFSKAMGTEEIEMASEDEFRTLFPDCETGAMPPFGLLYDLSTYVSTDLKDNDLIAFNACNHTEIIRMKFLDYLELVKPKMVHFEIS